MRISPHSAATFIPARASLPLLGVVLAATSAAAQPSRPNSYAAPVDAPYRAIEVRVPSPQGALGGTLTIPCGATGSLPAAVLIAGTGVQDRDGAVQDDSYRPLREIADALSREGVAVLRFDDRGAAEGRYWTPPTAAHVAEDVRAALSLLRERAEIDSERLFLIGHSEGGIVAPMVAASDPRVRGVILLAAPARPWLEIRRQAAQLSAARDTTLRTAEARDSAARALFANDERIASAVAAFRFLAHYDPIPVARSVRVPHVLVLHGKTDQQVPATDAALLAAAFRETGTQDVSVQLLAETNHLMVHDPSGDPFAYQQLPSHALTTEVLGHITGWVSERLGKGAVSKPIACR